MSDKARYAQRKKKKREVQKRHTHAVAAGLEDALAVSIDMAREAEDSLLILRRRISDLWEILAAIRAGPNSYPVDRPAGTRAKRRFIDE